MGGTFQVLTETLVGALVLGAVFSAALVASGVALVGAIRRVRGRRPRRRKETLFVARWGARGPEMYRVGKGVRRLPGPLTTLDFAREMLAEVMRCRPATPLARAFADAELEPLPSDGFVLSTSDVEAWLDEHVRSGGRSSHRSA